MKTLFENKKQASKVRLVLWLAVFLAVAALYGGWILFNGYGLAEADGGVLKPLGLRLALGGGIALAGCVFGGGMMLYATLYLLKLERDGERILIQTLSALGMGFRQHVFEARDIRKAAYFEGKLLLDLSVDAPWVKLNFAGRRLPFILDLRAETVRVSELKKLSKF